MCMVTNQEVEAVGSEIWVGRGGKKTPVKDMSDAHVRAAFSVLLKKIRMRSQPAEVEADSVDFDDQADSGLLDQD